MSSDVMGAVYEKFLAHKLAQKDGRIIVEDTDELRKKEGIYYTPRYIVDYIVAHTLGEKIKPVLAEAKALLGYKNFKGAYDKICELAQIKVLDPAMGSGSFLLGAFDALAAAYNDYNAECEKQKRNGGNGDGNGDALFDAPAAKPRPVERLGTAIVSHNLFGVDLDAQAVEVAKLNLWIRLMAAEKDSLRMKLHDPNKGKVPQNLLPALAANFKRGNSLIDDAKVAGDAAFNWEKEFPQVFGRERVSRAASGVAPEAIQRDAESGVDSLSYQSPHHSRTFSRSSGIGERDSGPAGIATLRSSPRSLVPAVTALALVPRYCPTDTHGRPRLANPFPTPTPWQHCNPTTRSSLRAVPAHPEPLDDRPSHHRPRSYCSAHVQNNSNPTKSTSSSHPGSDVSRSKFAHACWFVTDTCNAK